METFILETAKLPKAITGRIHTRRVRVVDFESGITLLPLEDLRFLDGSGISSEDFSKRKQFEKELEYERERRLHAPQLSKKQIGNIKTKYPSVSHLVGKFREV